MTDSKLLLTRYVDALQTGHPRHEFFAEDATWTLHAGDLPLAGTWRGRAAILDDFLGRAMSLYEPGSISIEVTAMIAEGDQVALQWTTRARTLEGEPYENGCLGIFTVRDGVITAVREYMDTLYAREVAYAKM
jgi:ketosteroid isomerase-like protein